MYEPIFEAVLTGDFTFGRVDRDPLDVDRVGCVLGHAEYILAKHGLNMLNDRLLQGLLFVLVIVYCDCLVASSILRTDRC